MLCPTIRNRPSMLGKLIYDHPIFGRQRRIVGQSNWNGTYDAVGAANGGLDPELPSGKHMNRANLLPAVESGKVSIATIDDKVRRILRHGRRVSAEAKALAARADVVVVAAGFDHTIESEGADRTFRLPVGQDELIRELAAANKNTIVVLTSGGGVGMSEWLARVPSVVQAWYPGQEGGADLRSTLQALHLTVITHAERASTTS